MWIINLTEETEVVQILDITIRFHTYGKVVCNLEGIDGSHTDSTVKLKMKSITKCHAEV